ncbi:peptidyl-prolyl cis-trans isomerase A (cyclophilin A) [Polymorphobacter multimanifer]|uniref:peptidylprolyl isomerase n=1 Tax=Polymorphobacter multimanifer TaxID=1070431 RepID=A0A841L341_9SPHN|nr:peptidylprolyl isomerase [Polymorphobacter multimanifer]MBB6226716.1 peptidyl-prolyl cis-trans isomerase A (cyclophilin A) [Polymorphobacter multimanifer]
MRLMMAMGVLGWAAAASAQPVAETGITHVKLETALGPIILRLEGGKAPMTVRNFLRYVDQKRLDGTGFYRAMKIGEPGSFGLVQGGVRGEAKRALPPVAHEPTSQTGLSNTDGAISMARAAPGSATGDFFIILGDLSSLDAKPDAAPPPGGDTLGFAAFGRVVEGMAVVKAIQSAPISPTAGDGPMKGQMIAEPVKILKASRVTWSAPPEFDPEVLPEP